MPGETANDLAHPTRRQQTGQPGVAIAGVIVDDGQAFGALGQQRLDQFIGQAGGAEAADHDRRAVGHISQRGCEVGNCLVDHRMGFL